VPAPSFRSPLLNSILLDSTKKTPTLNTPPSPHVGCQQSLSVDDCLKKLQASKDSRNVFRSLNYNNLDMHIVELLPQSLIGMCSLSCFLLRSRFFALMQS
jgi:hypothetical protein